MVAMYGIIVHCLLRKTHHGPRIKMTIRGVILYRLCSTLGLADHTRVKLAIWYIVGIKASSAALADAAIRLSSVGLDFLHWND